MSVISNIHTATVYNAKTSRAFDGQRLVVSIAKKDANGNYGQHLQQTMCTSIPALTLAQVDAALSDDSIRAKLLPHVLELLKGTQSDYISGTIKNTGRKEFLTEQLEITSLIDYLNTESVSDKWDAERIATWFDDTLAIPLTEKLMELGKDDSTIDKLLIAARKRFADALGSKAVISKVVAVELDKALKYAPDANDAIVKRFQTRLNRTLVSASLEDSLGL